MDARIVTVTGQLTFPLPALMFNIAQSEMASEFTFAWTLSRS